MTFILIIPRRQTRGDSTLNLLRCVFSNFIFLYFVSRFSIASYAKVHFDLHAIFPGKDCFRGERIVVNMFVSALQAGVDIGVKKNIVFRWQPPAGHDVSDKPTSHLLKGALPFISIEFRLSYKHIIMGSSNGLIL